MRMSPVRSRLVIVLGALCVGALFLAGLFVAGPAGGAMLAVTDVILVGLTGAAWRQLRPQTRPLRLVIIVAVAALAIAKLAGAG